MILSKVLNPGFSVHFAYNKAIYFEEGKPLTVETSCKLIEMFETCPKCGAQTIGNGTGTLDVDTAAGYFKRTCACGWGVEVQEIVEEEKRT